MNVLLFGESCTGKSTVAKALSSIRDMKIFTGKDYLRLSKNKFEAANLFKEMLKDNNNNIIFVATEKEQVNLCSKSMVKILFIADIETKKERFSKRFRGNLPKPVEKMIENRHGMFDDCEHDLVIDQNQTVEKAVNGILQLIQERI